MVEHLIEVIQKPRILHDRLYPKEEVKPKKPSKNLLRLLNLIKMRKWTSDAQNDFMALIIQMRQEVKFIEHLPKCWMCQMNLRLDVERYNGTHTFWFLSLENNEYLEERYPSCPKERNYHIGNYWEQYAYYKKYGNTNVPGENTLQFILDRAKWAYKIYGKQIRLARKMLKMVRNWRFNDNQQILEFNRLYERLGR